ncbi:ectonucleoside triphosphate diphosphohydrolase [Vairimorpha necatrix]|uniref:Ectonucleoside triphosphate diphosphohydrolase n=1 Tax=Vairimorpha necatrix TaxID=6039 RepID=A0AAX4JBN0_9MICR
MLSFLIGIIDIGSTGTRFNIFGYSEDKELIKYKHYEVPGGLHKMNRQEIRDSLNKLTIQLPEYVFKIPVGVYCTAGFRHPLNLKKLKFIKALLLRFNIKEAGILSGEYEGYLGYQSLKYILKLSNFNLIDMGGASTQVVTRDNYKSYQIGTTNLEDIKNIKNIKPIDNNLPVYISSGFTRNQKLKIKDINNEYLKIFLDRLGVKRDLIGVKVNWTLGMSLRYINQNI